MIIIIIISCCHSKKGIVRHHTVNWLKYVFDTKYYIATKIVKEN
jgi:hypothetical protein